MAIRKLSAHYIFNGKDELIKNGILVLDEYGVVRELRRTEGKLREEEGLEFYSGIISPGFVNAHCHIELSHLKGVIAKEKGMTNFIHSVIPQRETTIEIIESAMRKADLEMQKEGIVAIGDVCNTDVSFALKAVSSIYYHSFIELFGMTNSMAEKIFEKGVQIKNIASEKYGLKASIVPHSSYTVSENLFKLFRERLDNPGNILSVHNQESEQEDDFIRNRKGDLFNLYNSLGLETGDSKKRNISPLEYLQQSLPEKAKRLYVHNVETRSTDVDHASPDMGNTFWVICPSSNLYISGKMPNRFLIEQFPENVCIGTDSLASNDQLSIMKELFTMQEHYEGIPLEHLLRFACYNGALALGMDAKLGSFEPGKTPGINLIRHADLQKLKLLPQTSIRVLR